MPTDSLGQVLNLYISVGGEEKRIQKEMLQIDALGVVDDKFYSKDENRAILITSIASYKLAKENSIELANGLLGENIIIDYNPYCLNARDRFLIGEVELEITQNCTLCNGLSKVNSKLPKLLKHGRGVFAKAIKSGRIKIGDKVRALTTYTNKDSK